MADDFIIADIVRPDTENGAPVANIGEDTTGEGFGADVSVWGNGDGFVSVPNPPSDAGVAQAVVMQDGHAKRATQTRDQRWVTKAGELAPGDRAIVSDSDAWIRLTKANDKIEIVSGDMSVTMEAGVITIKNGPLMQLKMTTSEVVIGPPAGFHSPVLHGPGVNSGVFFVSA